MIEVTEYGAVRDITFARPGRRNAFTPADLDALEAALEDAPRVVYLHGAGGAFSAGADLDVVAGLDGDDAHAFAKHGQRVANAIAGSDSVVVAGIDGPARGGGVELALACDVRVATSTATFAETGVTLGLFGAWGGTARLPAIVGLGNALDLGLSGRVVDAEEALRMGLVSRVVTEPRVVADEIAECPADALATVKARLRDSSARVVQEEQEASAFAVLVDAHAESLADR